MKPQTSHRVRRRRRFASALLVAMLSASSAHAEEDPTLGQSLIDALIGGKPTLNVRARIEIADSDAPMIKQAEAYTVRTRLGYGTKPLHGVRIYADFENIATLAKSQYFDPTRPPNDDMKTVIADPPSTEVNQAFLEIDRPDWLGSKLKAGRQRQIFDDARFIGNVGWRQNEQTYDGVFLDSTLGRDDLRIQYGWIGHVNRIFGGGGNNPALDDFTSDSHVVNISYAGIPHLKLIGFGYWLDLQASDLPEPAEDANSHATYGVRVQGSYPISEDFEVDYLGSYAFQQDYADNAADYEADYGHGNLGVKFKGLGRVAAAFEYLGSDDGLAVFGTPLSTAHKFNGWADTFLNNGGPTGLQDLYIQVQPALPWGLKMLFMYHRFWDADTDTHRGDGYDIQLTRQITPNWGVLTKAGIFVDESDLFPEVDLWRFWMETTFKF